MKLPNLLHSLKKNIALLTAGSLLALGVSTSAQALPFLDLIGGTPPDIVTQELSVTYDASTRMLDVVGTPFVSTFLNPAGGSNPVLSPTFNLSAQLNSTFTSATGSLSISGNVLGVSMTPPPVPEVLLTGDLAVMGTGEDMVSGAAIDPLQFLFTVTGGTLANLYGATAGVILNATGFAGDFGQNFSSGIAFADTFGVPQTTNTIPEPTTVMILLMGFVLLYRQFGQKQQG